MLRILILSILPVIVTVASPRPIQWQLPTENRHLLSGEPEKFYMYVDRYFEGEKSTPWEGGSWGVVRSPVRVGEQVKYLRFHEGIDIAPVKRDKAGNPLDLIMSIADGRVVYVCDTSKRSNYGMYIVVEHPIHNDGSTVYSLYAHLAEATVKAGDPVKKGSVLGRMGYTGAGINRTRAHVHLELGLLLNKRFDGWYQVHGSGLNKHGLYHGFNLIGMDVARFLTESHKNPNLTVTEFVRKSPAYFKVTVPRPDKFDFAERHPWLIYGDINSPGPSVEIAFTGTGLPTGIAVSQRKVNKPTVTAVKKSGSAHRYPTRGLLSGSGDSASLTSSGRKLVALVTGDFPDPTPKPE